MKIAHHLLQGHGLHIVDSRAPYIGIMTIGVTGSLMSGLKDNKAVRRRSATDDELIQATCKQLGRNMVKLIHQLNA